MSSTFRIPLHIVFYKEAGRYIARCLEFDLIGDGETREAALECLSTAILIQIEFSIEHDNVHNLVAPADGQYFRMFYAGKDVAVGNFVFEELSAVRKDVVIETSEFREYECDDLAMV